MYASLFYYVDLKTRNDMLFSKIEPETNAICLFRIFTYVQSITLSTINNNCAGRHAMSSFIISILYGFSSNKCVLKNITYIYRVLFLIHLHSKTKLKLVQSLIQLDSSNGFLCKSSLHNLKSNAFLSYKLAVYLNSNRHCAECSAYPIWR